MCEPYCATKMSNFYVFTARYEKRRPIEKKNNGLGNNQNLVSQYFFRIYLTSVFYCKSFVFKHKSVMENRPSHAPLPFCLE